MLLFTYLAPPPTIQEVLMCYTEDQTTAASNMFVYVQYFSLFVEDLRIVVNSIDICNCPVHFTLEMVHANANHVKCNG